MDFKSTFRRLYGQAARDAAYLLLTWPILLVAFIVSVTLVSLGVGTVIIWVGIPILAFALAVTGLFAEVGRRSAALVDSSAPIVGEHRRAPEGSGAVTRLLTMVRDSQRWLEVVWVLVDFWVGLFAWVVTVMWLSVTFSMPFGLLVQSILDRTLGDRGSSSIAELLGLEPEYLWLGIIYTVVFILFGGSLPFVLRGLAALRQAIARGLLGWAGEVGRLEVSRSAVVQAEADARARLERDIHDGPQQRLVRLGIDLARVKRRLPDEGGQEAREIIDSAMEQAQATLEELRQLSRGIAPPILIERGLGAALVELADRSAVPTQVEVDLPELPAHVEQAAYFVVSEALTNVAKHSGALRAAVRARLDGDWLRVSVEDDGVGGADPAKGHGLVGLTQRVAGG
ncbi:sensor domain-containing protein [Schaalia sp. 19OD2882]|uniref:sensor histidine kinase n=1 Tax=Schaalia sp. 19OD2882 TaxID=2794089 RepID=UPI0020A76D60|nr:sensor domain-containing protein [Schaalia sp. 19OD2882]